MEATRRSWVGGRYVDLIDVLELVGENPWRWRLEDEFEGSALPGIGLDLVELDERLRRGEFQYFEWSDLLSFARQLNQMIWGRVVALKDGDGAPVLALDCIDSSAWDLTAQDAYPEAVATLRRVLDGWPPHG